MWRVAQLVERQLLSEKAEELGLSLLTVPPLFAGDAGSNLAPLHHKTLGTGDW